MFLKECVTARQTSSSRCAGLVLPSQNSHGRFGKETAELIDIPNLSDDELVERLALHAHSKLRKLFWRGVPYTQGGAVPGGVSPEDLAAEAVESFLDGTRVWDKTKKPEFLDFLMSVVDSKVSHLVESAENRQSRRIKEDQNNEPAYNVTTSAKATADSLVDNEQQDLVREAIFAAIKDDELATGVLECMDADLTKPSQIADHLGVDVKDVNNAQKRLRRAVDKAFASIGRSNHE